MFFYDLISSETQCIVSILGEKKNPLGGIRLSFFYHVDDFKTKQAMTENVFIIIIIIVIIIIISGFHNSYDSSFIPVKWLFTTPNVFTGI